MRLIRSLILFISAQLVFIPLIAIGLPMSLIVFWIGQEKSFKDFLFYFWGIFSGFFNALAYIIHALAVGVDIIANALSGQALEFTITKERNTLLGSGRHTISAAMGDLNRKKAMLPNGKRLTSLLNWVFNEIDHCEYALRQEELVKEFKKAIPKQR